MSALFFYVCFKWDFFFFFHPAEHLMESTPDFIPIVSKFPPQQMGACRKHKSCSFPAWLLLSLAPTVVNSSTRQFEHIDERQSNTIDWRPFLKASTNFHLWWEIISTSRGWKWRLFYCCLKYKVDITFAACLITKFEQNLNEYIVAIEECL